MTLYHLKSCTPIIIQIMNGKGSSTWLSTWVQSCFSSYLKGQSNVHFMFAAWAFAVNYRWVVTAARTLNYFLIIYYTYCHWWLYTQYTPHTRHALGSPITMEYKRSSHHNFSATKLQMFQLWWEALVYASYDEGPSCMPVMIIGPRVCKLWWETLVYASYDERPSCMPVTMRDPRVCQL